jgi:carbonic anhydrase
MNQLKTLAVILSIAVILLLSCNNSPKQAAVQASPADSSSASTPAVTKVLTKQDQAALTPDTIVQILKQGNAAFSAGNGTAKNYVAQVKASAGGQYPMALILSCIDSRVPTEEVFDRGIGDIFVARVAGNIVNEDILGSMEFSCKVLGAKLVLVLGHTNCGAIKSAIDDVKVGNVTALLSKIKPAVAGVTNFQGDKKSKNPAFVQAVCEQNVRMTIQAIRDKSDILKQMEAKGQIKIVGGVYDLNTGQVSFLQ